MEKEYVLIIENKWTGNKYVHPVLYTNDEALAEQKNQTNNNVIIRVYRVIPKAWKFID